MSDRRRTFSDQLYFHFVTSSCHGRRKLLDEDHPKRIVLGQLNACLLRYEAKCVGFVVMPDHVHAILWFPETDKLSVFLQQWKRLTSHTIRKWMSDHMARYFAEDEIPARFWTPRYYSFEIYSESKLIEKLEYMHLNPVRAGLVEKAVDWQWSSARWYEQQKSVGVPVGWIE